MHGKCTHISVGHAHGTAHHARKVLRLLQQDPHSLSQPPLPAPHENTQLGAAQRHLVLSLGVRPSFNMCKVSQGPGVTATLLNVSASSSLILPHPSPRSRPSLLLTRQ